jgi:hypothetical protein
MNLLHPDERDSTHFTMQKTVEDAAARMSCLGMQALRAMEADSRQTNGRIMVTQ